MKKKILLLLLSCSMLGLTACASNADSAITAEDVLAEQEGVSAVEDMAVNEPEEEMIVDMGVSSIYTDEDRNTAVSAILDEFDTWEGCEMHAIRYAGDEVCTEENLEWLNSLDEDANYTECIEFVSEFHSPVEGGGAWEPDQEYVDWNWWLARTDADSDWVLVNWGY